VCSARVPSSVDVGAFVGAAHAEGLAVLFF